MKTIYSLLFLLLTCFATASSQVTGRVCDADGKGLPFVNVVALSANDSTVLGGVVTKSDGGFTLAAAPARRILRFALMGYGTGYRTVDGGNKRLGTITLSALDAALGEATVTFRRPVSKLTGDGLSTSVENTTLSKAGTANDVLERVPGIMKKADGLEVIGKGTPVYYINGRRLQNLSELDHLRSEDIKSVEVINNPGARYDASVSAVVRIRTVKRQGDGFSLDATAGYEQGQYANGNGELNMNYRHNSLDVFVNTSGNTEKYYWDSQMGGTIVSDQTWNQRAKQHLVAEQQFAEVTAGFNYDLAADRSFGLRYTHNASFRDRGNGYFDSEILCDDVFYDSLANDIDMSTDGDPEHRLNAYYTGRLGKGTFSVDADFVAGGESKEQISREHSMNEENRDVHSTNNVRNRLWAAKAEYSFPALGGRFTIGSHYTGTNRHDNYLIPDNDFNIPTSYSQLKEQSIAGFAEYARAIGQAQLSAGLRYEHVDFDYYDQGVRQEEQSRRFSDFFPSLSISGKAGQVTLMASYSAKTIRPSYHQLSNNLTYANRYLMQGGNPYLRPSVKHDLTLTGVWKILQATANFYHAKDDILFWGAAYEDDPRVTHVTFINKSHDGYMASLTASPVIGLWHPTATAGIVGGLLELETQSGTKRFSRPICIFNLNNDFTLPAGFLLNVLASYQSEGNFQNVTLASDKFYVQASVRKSFFDDRFSVTAGLRDIFNQMNDEVRMNFEKGDMLQGGRGDRQRFYVTLRYKFNAARSKYRGRSAVEDEMRRL